jgi:hypothetical protein
MRRIWLRGLAGLAAGGLMLFASACGSSDPQSPGGGNPAADGADGASEGARLTVTFDITGGTTIKGTVTADIPSNSLAPTTCAEYAAGMQSDGRTVFSLPSLELAGQVGGHEVSVEAGVNDYNGPGTYTADKLYGVGSRANILVDKKQQYEVLVHTTDTKMVVDAYGGGAWTFTHLSARSDTPQPGIDGKISWTCK